MKDKIKSITHIQKDESMKVKSIKGKSKTKRKSKEASVMARMFSEEQIAMANSVDIASFLQMQGEALIKSGKDMRWARHTSITVRGNRFYDWKAEAGGYPIAFVQRYFNYNFKQAVEFLLSNVGDLQMSVPYEKQRRQNLNFLKKMKL